MNIGKHLCWPCAVLLPFQCSVFFNLYTQKASGAEPETTGPVPVDRHHGHAHGTKYGTRYTFGIVKSASNKIDKLAACCKFRSFEYRERCIDDRYLAATQE